MPFGLTFVGTAFSESKLLAFAYAYEQATQTRLNRKAYTAATPKTQLADVVGKANATMTGSNSTASGSNSTAGGSGGTQGGTDAATSVAASHGLCLLVVSLVCVQGFIGWV
jgi:amidase